MRQTDTRVEPPPKPFDVELFIVHPTMRPEEISSALGLEAKFFHCVGEPRRTPKGTPLPGIYSDTRWRHTSRHEAQGQHFADAVVAFVRSLEPHAPFLSRVRSTGGRAQVIVQFLGDGYFGDEIPRATLARLAELDLDLGLEVYTDPQRS